MTKVKTFPVTRADLALILASSPDRVSKFVAEGCPVLQTGSGRGSKTMLDLAAVVPWLLTRKANTLDEARTRQANASADKLELETKARRGELVELAEVAREFEDCANAVKARLRRIPDSVSDRVLGLSGPGEVKNLLLTEIDNALLELSRTGEPGDDETNDTKEMT